MFVFVPYIIPAHRSRTHHLYEEQHRSHGDDTLSREFSHSESGSLAEAAHPDKLAFSESGSQVEAAPPTWPSLAQRGGQVEAADLGIDQTSSPGDWSHGGTADLGIGQSVSAGGYSLSEAAIHHHSHSSSRLARLLAGYNAWYDYCLTAAGGYCAPCEQYERPCENDDLEGSDESICMLPTYYGGNVDEEGLCGASVTPVNIGREDISITLASEATAVIGQLMQFIDVNGRWYGIIRLQCPYMLLLGSSAGQYIQYNVTNSAFPSSLWSTTIDRSLYGGLYRTCTTYTIVMDTIDPCRTSVINMTVDFFARATIATDDDTCDVLDSATDGQRVSLGGSGWD
eukprot:gene6806-30777_t